MSEFGRIAFEVRALVERTLEPHLSDAVHMDPEGYHAALEKVQQEVVKALTEEWPADVLLFGLIAIFGTIRSYWCWPRGDDQALATEAHQVGMQLREILAQQSASP